MNLRLCSLLSVLALAACGKLAPATAGPGEACVRNADCADPYVCINAVCSVDLRRVCEADELRCNGNAIESCLEGGAGWGFVETCATGCSQGSCNPTVCTPGVRRCEESALFECSGDGTRWIWLQTCLSGCDASTTQCKSPVCTPFEAKCGGGDEAVVETCDPRGAGWVSTACRPEEVCSQGRCLPTVCTTIGEGDSAVRQRRCKGDVLELCNDQGTAFVATESCEFGCNDTNHQAACVPPACAAGATSCVGDALYRCSPDRRSTSFLNFCPAGCETTNGVAECRAPMCVGLSRRCGIDAATSEPLVEQCSADGTAWTAIESCQQTCAEGQCVLSDAGCVPGTRRCAGVESEVCVRVDGGATEWRFEERCFGGCSGGVCQAGGSCGCVGGATGSQSCGGTANPVIRLSALLSSSAPPVGDGVSSVLINTDVIAGVSGAPVPDGTLVTFTHDGVLSLFASGDADPVTPGLQRPTRHGRARVVLKAPHGAMDVAVFASLGGSCAGQTTVTFHTADDGPQSIYVAEDFSTLRWKDRTNTTVTWDALEGRLEAAPGFDFGTGLDGDIAVAAGQTLDLFSAGYIHASNVVSMGDADVVVDKSVTRLSRGDEVLLIALTGSSAAVAGNWEFKKVASVSGSHVRFEEPVRRLYGATTNHDLTGQRVVLQYVPQFNDVTVETNGKLTVTPYASQGTGVLAMRARGTVRLVGNLDVAATGLMAAQPVAANATLDKLLLGGGGALAGGGVAYVAARAVTLRPDEISPVSGRVLARSTGGYGGAVWLQAGTLSIGSGRVDATGSSAGLNGRVRLDYGMIDTGASTLPAAYAALEGAFQAQSIATYLASPLQLRRVEMLGAAGGSGRVDVAQPALIPGLDVFVTATTGTTFTPVDAPVTNFSPTGGAFRYRVRLRPLEDTPMELFGLAFRLEAQ